MKVVITKLESNPKLEALKIEDEEGNIAFSIGYSEDALGAAFLRLMGEIQQIEAESESLMAKFAGFQEIRRALSHHMANPDEQGS